ncbi:MAG: thiamine phosphate synthase [Pseudomonadales bacterium]|nr:thiamine phosphate synthase [Pseudomonadales bacterium]
MPANDSIETALSREKQQRLNGLYAITDSTLTPEATIRVQVEQALAGGARIIQYRDKSKDQIKRKQQASELLALCEAFSATLIINDDPELAADVNAHGVHLGLTDSPIEHARALLGQDAIIGATCHGSIDNAREAITLGADYVAFGRFFPSATKPDAEPAQLANIEPHLSTLAVPAVAIGGITLANAPQLRAAGFAMLAVVGDIFQNEDIANQSQRYAQLFQS